MVAREYRLDFQQGPHTAQHRVLDLVALGNQVDQAQRAFILSARDESCWSIGIAVQQQRCRFGRAVIDVVSDVLLLRADL